MSVDENAGNSFGEIKIIFSATGGNSNFNFSTVASDLFSDFFPAVMALHNGHGCSPSKVFETASEKDSLPKLAASIVVHARVCSAAQ